MKTDAELFFQYCLTRARMGSPLIEEANWPDVQKQILAEATAAAMEHQGTHKKSKDCTVSCNTYD